MPTRNSPWPNGTPCWVDYGASDVDAAKDFYGRLLGWEFTGGDPEYGGYLNATRNGEPAAGLGPLMDPGDSPGWTTYFSVDDSQATVARIREAGGTVVVEPMEVGPMGTMTIAVDPQGNPFGLWQSGQHTGVRVYNEPGALVWNEAAVDDPAAAREFYSAVFGFTFDEVPGAGGYTTFATGGDPLGGLGGHQPGSPKGWATCFSVASTDDAVATVEAGGGKVTTAPMDTEFGRFAVVEDPWGAPLSVMQAPSGS
ncbi:VOC family protein [Geodermatophilus sp. TF02-6]|uniref:VOC family protein n=1 Tax=Geodermatophilus sp. TF02-6 TaxID=2250575 RepID=UPI000DE82A9B|nr:VOC family protein [Geodermatophilus sp. TF02-6]RBY78297.1 VOC family protein [Geodermatophilus sp. TF02-6]